MKVFYRECDVLCKPSVPVDSEHLEVLIHWGVQWNTRSMCRGLVTGSTATRSPC